LGPLQQQRRPAARTAIRFRRRQRPLQRGRFDLDQAVEIHECVLSFLFNGNLLQPGFDRHPVHRADRHASRRPHERLQVLVVRPGLHRKGGGAQPVLMPARFSADTPVNTMLGNTETTLAFAGGGSATSPSPRAAASLNHSTAARSSEPVPTPCPSANGRIHRVDAAPRRSALEQGKRALGVALRAPTFHQPQSEHVVAARGPALDAFSRSPTMCGTSLCRPSLSTSNANSTAASP
jgi:hypothetical protein